MNSYAQNSVIVTPRIYYREEKLLGNPIETKIINLENFNYIVQNARQQTYKIEKKTRLVLKDGDFESVYVDMFKYCTVRRDGITYDSDEGSFYLPEALILFDNSDYAPFPSEFYYIAKINDRLELGFCKGGEGVKWHELPSRRTTVEDSATIEKAEETIDYFKDFVAYEVEQEEEAEAERALAIANREFLGEETKSAYIALTELCMPDSPRKKEVLSFIDGLKQYDDDEEYRTTYNEFRMYLNHNGIPFIITLDWKEAADELEAWIQSAVEENFKKTFHFEDEGKYDEDSSVSDDGLFSAFDRQLQKIGLAVGMIETDGDEYQMIVYPAHKKDKAIRAMKTIGISYKADLN